MGWCNHVGSQLHIGDFNGDEKADMLCHDKRTGHKSVALANSAGQFTGTSWQKAMGWCNHAGSELYVGDFNGDGRTDMLCHDSAGKKWIALANSAGQFTGNSWYRAMGWCNHAGSQLHIGDFNGDGKADMLCHDTRNGYKWVALANSAGQFTGTSWQKAMGWCNHAGSELYVGDFNGDGRTDMLCHDSAGKKWIALATSAGQFTGTFWENAMGWCNHAGSKLFTGDFNRDGRTDMLCHDTRNGYKWVALATCEGRFTRTTWEKAMGWCYHAGSELHVGDFNGDGRTDILCHDTVGKKWIALAKQCQRLIIR